MELTPIHVIDAALAQLVEHRIRNAGVRGSNPLSGTITFRVHSCHMVYILYRAHGLHFLRCEWVCGWFDAVLLVVEEA